ncbi:flagellin [Agromyces mediolanus]|jgi:flagellin|uniref:Flagellin n=1 Tax=Agromyces mediolanus TaxID=41986 RepID=A0A918CEW5_AGRME|nr:flagellin [Agromyces mediolanus]MCD1572455.1 flagellin [Agromyces mediolanus]GGR19251.1 flagellin [Agromyces mediolanus]GLJ71329.1 flagellin [Agromyces mediolanus]
MGMQINTNVAAFNAHRNLTNTQNELSKSLEKLSSGLRINRAADDAAGLAISEGLRSQISGTKVAARNAQDGISVIQTAEGALTEVHNILHRMRDLAVQGASDSNNTESRAAIQKEADALSLELYRVSEGVNFNGIDLLKGGSLNFQVGAGDTANDTIAINLANVGTSVGTLASADGTAAGAGFVVTSNATANTTLTSIDTAITAISTARADLGAQQNRFESTIRTLNVSAENLSAAESRIRDTDMAAEMVSYTRASILSQAGTAMLAQANQANQGVLKLLG